MDADALLKQILRDIKVEVLDAASMNFRNQGFFGEAWKRRVGPLRPGGATLVDSGRLRKSISSEIQGNSIVFTYGEKYAPYHNEGAEVRVTEKMKMFFRRKYYEASSGITRDDKDGSRKRRRGKLTDGGFYAMMQKRKAGPEAEFWGYLSLKKVGSVIKIPRRRFLGSSPQLEAAVREIIEKNLEEYFKGLKIKD